MPDFSGNGNGRKAELDKLPEDATVEEKAEYRRSVEKAQGRGAPPKIIEPRCKVCVHPNRQWIEYQIISAATSSSIERAFSGTPNPVPRRSVDNHKAQHLDLQDAAMRAVIESEAELEGRNFDNAMGDILTKRGVFEVLFRKGFKDVVDGNISVEPRDMIQMAKIMQEWENASATAAVDEARLQVQIFVQAIRNTWEPEMQAQLVAEIKRLKHSAGLGRAEELLADSSKEEYDEPIVDAEILPAG